MGIDSIGKSTGSWDIWDKYREWYFKIHQNMTSRRGEWYLGSFEISRASIYPKYPEETVLFFCLYYKAKKFRTLRNTHFYLVTRNWLSLQQHVIKHVIAQTSHNSLNKTVLEYLLVSVLKGESF